MSDLIQKLIDGAEWVEANAQYHFKEHQKHDPMRQSLNAAEAMREAATILRARAEQRETPDVAAAVEDVRDAARYRWLREQHWHESSFAVVRNPIASIKLGCDCPSEERLDEIIDAALAAVDKPDLTPHEREVLEMVAGWRTATWGAWVAACLERLRSSGYITQYVGMNPKLTDAGRAALDNAASEARP